VEQGASVAETVRKFKVSRWTVYRYLDAQGSGQGLAPKPRGGSAKRFGDGSLRREVAANPSATLSEHAKALGVSHVAVWLRLRQLKITLKKTPEVRRAGRARPLVLPA